MDVKITDEQRKAIHTHQPGKPVRVEDELDQRVYLLVAVEDLPLLWADYVQSRLDEGLSAIQRGEVAEWDPGKFKKLAQDVAAGSKRGR